MMQMDLSFILMTMPDFGSSAVWLSLLTLTFLEIVLGVDNIIFISIAASKLPKEQQAKATNIGLILAMVMRVALLFGISWLIAMNKPWFTIDLSWIHAGFSGQSLILIAGGLFDSILTAVGMTNGVEGALIIMIIAVVFSVVIMMLFAVPVGRFVNKHPTIQMLGLSFLILIGFMLILEGGHLAEMSIFGSHIGIVPKGYLYFAIAFSLLVEFLNMKLRRNKPVPLNTISEEAEREGVI